MELAGIAPHTEFDLSPADNDAIRQACRPCSAGVSSSNLPSTPNNLAKAYSEQPSAIAEQERIVLQRRVKEASLKGQHHCQ